MGGLVLCWSLCNCVGGTSVFSTSTSPPGLLITESRLVDTNGLSAQSHSSLAMIRSGRRTCRMPRFMRDPIGGGREDKDCSQRLRHENHVTFQRYTEVNVKII